MAPCRRPLELGNVRVWSGAKAGVMIHYVVAFALLLHVLFWGAGAAMLAMPKRWRRFWPVLIVPAGLALQSAVVWAGAHAGLRGTQSYAWWSELVPLGLLFVAFRRDVL